MMLSLFAVAILAAPAAPSSPDEAIPEERRAQLTSDSQDFDQTGDVLVAKGHCILRTNKISIWADEIEYDHRNQRATARGHVMLVHGLWAAIADQAQVDIATNETTLQGGLVQHKRNVKPEALLSVTTPEQLKKSGQTTFVMTGARIKRISENRFLVKQLSFTPCDCDLNKPSWRIEAFWADVEPGERAILWFPVVYLHHRLPIIGSRGSVPILPLPALYLPLSDRRSGLLFPRIGSSVIYGFSFEQPLFITLGRSYDLTLTPGHYSGGDFPQFGVKGYRLGTEFRYVPSTQTSGRFTFGAINDEKEQRDPRNFVLVPNVRRGLRWESSLQHDQDLGKGFHDRVDASLVSDGFLVADLTSDIVAKVNQYLRSTAVVYRRDSETYAGLDVAYRQDTRYGYSIFGNDRDQKSPDLTPLPGPKTLQRMPGIVYAIPEQPLRGPLFGSLHLEYARISPLLGGTGDEGTKGVFDPNNPDPNGSQGDRRFQPGEREARDRLDLRPRLSASFPLGQLARLSPYAALRESLYLGEVTGAFSHRGYLMGGMTLATELSRVYRPSGSLLRHTVAPSVEFRYVPPVVGSGWPAPYDEVDSPVPRLGLTQAIAQVSQRLSRRTGNSTTEVGRLDVGQDLDLGRHSAGDLFARLSLYVGPLTVSGVSRYDPSAARMGQLSTSLKVAITSTISVSGSYDYLTALGPEGLRREIDTLVGPRSDPLVGFVLDSKDLSRQGGRAQQAFGAISAAFRFGLSLSYYAILKPILRLRDPLKPETEYQTWSPAQQVASVSYSPTCGCWGLSVAALVRPDLTIPNQTKYLTDLFFSFSISSFGSIGFSGAGSGATFAN